jgi:hypothetical protein
MVENHLKRSFTNVLARERRNLVFLYFPHPKSLPLSTVSLQETSCDLGTSTWARNVGCTAGELQCDYIRDLQPKLWEKERD